MRGILVVLALIVAAVTARAGSHTSVPEREWIRSYAIDASLPDTTNGLSISLNLDASCLLPDGLLVEVVMTNTTDRGISLWDRGNSWGAYNWWFDMRNDKEDRFIFAQSPRRKWTENFPFTLTIPPHSQYTMRCQLLLRSVPMPYGSRGQLFVPVATNDTQMAQWDAFLKGGPSALRGVYGNQLERYVDPRGWLPQPTAWVGKMATPWTRIPK